MRLQYETASINMRLPNITADYRMQLRHNFTDLRAMIVSVHTSTYVVYFLGAYRWWIFHDALDSLLVT